MRRNLDITTDNRWYSPAQLSDLSDMNFFKYLTNILKIDKIIFYVYYISGRRFAPSTSFSQMVRDIPSKYSVYKQASNITYEARDKVLKRRALICCVGR